MAEHSMEIHSILEVHFHDMDRASCFHETTATGSKQQFGEILHFCAFSARQIVNIANHPQGDQAGYMLQLLDGDPGGVRAIAERGRVSDLALVEYPGSRGKKRFETSMDMTEKRFRFNLKAKGFGFLGRGLGYYAPSSISVLLMYLGQRNLDDEKYLTGLAQAATLLGQAQLGGRLGLRNQNEVAWMCAMTGAAETNEWLQSSEWPG